MCGHQKDICHDVARRIRRDDHSTNSGHDKDKCAVTKRLVIAERIRLLASTQELKETIIQYVYKLREACRVYEFEYHGTGALAIEDELIHVRLIEVMRDSSYKPTILERLQLTKISLDIFIGFLQQLEVNE